MKKCPNCSAEYPDTQVFCADCGTKLNEVQVPSLRPSTKPPQSHRVYQYWICMVAVLLVTVLCQRVSTIQREKEIQYLGQIERFREEAEQYQEKAEQYRKLYEESKTEYEAAVDTAHFYTKYARILPADENGNYTEFYHIYGCPDCDTTSFWIYNIDTADRCANPCPLCCEND